MVFKFYEMQTVNSRHHQAVDVLAPTLVADAFSPDDIIEAASSHDMILVQWHPERLSDKEKSEAVNGSLLLDAFLHHYKFV